ncbi:MAG: hypothetical protein Q4G68_10035 [Planctomycetia bacterium]|nr:hypothetical protein [Planctomycetia bacterium]
MLKKSGDRQQDPCFRGVYRLYLLLILCNAVLYFFVLYDWPAPSALDYIAQYKEYAFRCGVVTLILGFGIMNFVLWTLHTFNGVQDSCNDGTFFRDADQVSENIESEKEKSQTPDDR